MVIAYTLSWVAEALISLGYFFDIGLLEDWGMVVLEVAHKIAPPFEEGGPDG